MNWFQLSAIPIAGLLFLQSARRLGRGGSRRTALAGMLVWLAAAVAILQPELTTGVARRLGIGRGADLLLYVLAILFLLACFYLYNRLQRLESAITGMVRHAAIQEALQRWPAPSDRAISPEGGHPGVSAP